MRGEAGAHDSVRLLKDNDMSHLPSKHQKLQQNGVDDRHQGNNGASASSTPPSSSFDYLTRLKAVGRVVSNHPVIHDTVAKTLETCRQRAPPGLFERDKMLAASVRMKIVRKTIDRITEDDKSMGALMEAYRDVADRLEHTDPTNEDLRSALPPKQTQKIDGLITDAARDTQGLFERDLDGFFATREARMQEKDKEKEEAAQEKAAAASGGGDNGNNSNSSNKRGRRKGKKRGAASDEEEPGVASDDAAAKLPSPLRACSEQELAAIGGAKRVAEQYAQLCPLGKRMFECFASVHVTPSAHQPDA